MPRHLAAGAAVTVAGLVSGLSLRTAVRRAGPVGSSRWVRSNHAGAPVTLAEGPTAVAGLLTGLGVARLCGAPGRRVLAVAVAGAAAGLVGAYDDLAGSSASRGFRGHLAALRRGEVTSGLVKIVGIGAAALAAAVIGGQSPGSGPRRAAAVLLDTALIAGTANLANLFDLRPGRAGKVLLLLGVPLAGSGAAAAVGATLGSLPADLAGRSMLGDCGANALGAAVATTAGQTLPAPARVVAVLLVAGLTAASERVSFSAVIDRTPVLRRLDRLGRPDA